MSANNDEIVISYFKSMGYEHFFFFLNSFKTLFRKHMVSLMQYKHIEQNNQWEALITFSGEKRKTKHRRETKKIVCVPARVLNSRRAF